MKLVIAIIQPHQLDEVKKALYAAEVNLITVNEVLGHGRQKGVTEVYRGVKETGNLLRKMRLEIAVNDHFVQPTINAIIQGARTGEPATARSSCCRWSDACGSAPAKRAPRRSGDRTSEKRSYISVVFRENPTKR